MGHEPREQNSLLRRVEDKIAGSPPAETVLNTFKAVLATVPFCGGLASLMTDYIPSSRLKRLERFATDVAQDLRRLQDQVREEYLHTDEFAFMFEKCFRGAAENPQKEKLSAFRGILVNSAIQGDLAGEEKEFFVNLVGNLSVVHIRLLSFMANPKEYLEAANIPQKAIKGGFERFLPIALQGIPMAIIRSSFEELYRYGLTKVDSSIFGTMTADSGLGLVENRVSELGRRFIEFCTVPVR